MNYFDKLPSIVYDGHTVKNLLARARLADSTKANRMAFYPYTLDSSVDRVDVLSNNYYDSPGYAWLIWMANDIVDPYYDLPMSEDDFFSFIMKKYGTIEKALRKIKCYRSNWYLHSEERVTVGDYSTLPSQYKKYYEPIVLTDDYNIHSYRRRQEDTIISTNKVVSINLSSANGSFTVGEEVGANATHYGFCTFSNTSVVSIQHVNGSFANGNILTGQESGTVATVANSVTISETLASTEASFWTPVTYFEYEQELNEMKKEIQLLDVRYKGQAESDLKRIMSSS
jgi:hypothetical protein